MKVFKFSLGYNKDIKQIPIYHDAVVVAKTKDEAAVKFNEAFDGPAWTVRQVAVEDITEIGVGGEEGVHISCIAVDYALEYFTRKQHDDESDDEYLIKRSETIDNIVNNGVYCPLPVGLINDRIARNLCSVKSVEWHQEIDGHLISFTIHFEPQSVAEAEAKSREIDAESEAEELCTTGE